MFKALRDRLKGVSKKLEEELDVELERRLDDELAAATRSPSGPEPSPETHEEREAPPVPERPAAEEDAREEETAVEEPSPETTPAAPERGETSVEQAPEPEPQDPGSSEHTATPGPEPEPAPETPAAADAGTAPPPETPAAADAGTAPPPEKPQPDAKPQQPPRYGRKFLTEDEVEARLRRELESAVETQRDVEQVAQPSGRSVARYTINEDVLDDILWELEVALLESDVAFPVVEAIKENVREQLLSMSVGGRDPHEIVEKVLRTAIRRVLDVDPIDFDAFVRGRLEQGKRPVVVMFVGVNGTGKTTSIARIAYRLQKQGVSSVMAAGDTFRAGAIEQLALHGERLGIRVVKHGAGADPAAVAYDAVEHAKARRKDVVLLDTAGRMQTNTNLMDEMDKIRRVADPDMVVFVGDSLAGNDAVEQARRFDEVVDINAVILTKVDVDAKGGAALSVAYTIRKPLMFVGVGQDYGDLRPFDSGWLVDRLFGAEAEAEAEASA